MRRKWQDFQERTWWTSSFNRKRWNTPYGDRKSIFNRDKETYLDFIGDHQYSVRTPRYGGSMTFTLKEVHKTLKRGDTNYWWHPSRIEGAERKNRKTQKRNFPFLNTQLELQSWLLQNNQSTSCAFQLVLKIILCILQGTYLIQKPNQILSQKIAYALIGSQKYLGKCNNPFFLHPRTYLKPKATLRYISQLVIYLQMNCSQ